MTEKHFLLVDDHGQTYRKHLEMLFEKKDVKIHLIEAFDKNKLYKALDQNPDISVILLDLYGPGESPEKTKKPAGIRLIEGVKKDDVWKNNYGKKVLIVVLTKHGTVKTEYIAAALYLEKYIEKDKLTEDRDLLLQIWERSQDIRTIGLIPSHLRKYEFVFHPNTVQMRAILEKVRKVAKFEDIPILILGETGSGKELMAKAIWKEIKLKREKNTVGMDQFTPFNIASIQKDLLHSQLFGYLKNSYTGANPKGSKGILQTADEDNATLFLDEIGDITPEIQVALLRVLQEKEILPVGATKHGFVSSEGKSEGKLLPGKKLNNLRFIFATNRNLEVKVKEGTFREDLYYRLNEFSIHVPSLRERKKDIRILAEHFRREFNERYGMGLDYPDSPHFMSTLESYDWPGNVRELEHDLKRCFIESSENKDGIIEFADDVKEKLTGQKQHGLKNIENLNIIFNDLPNNPMTLPEISKQRGEPIAIELGKMLIKENGRLPGEKDSIKYFAMKAGAFRHWMYERRITKESVLGHKKKKK